MAGGSGGNNKRKKHQDKDKFYRLAKEQGLRSRAAFKLSQINRQYPCLDVKGENAAVLDLCAAPGGWTQIAARTCPKSTLIVAVDILPIRSLPAHRNVVTIVGDLTTDQCKAEIKRTLQKHSNSNNNNVSGDKNSTLVSQVRQVQVVLHDGAPNIGADYGKDAYEQNELALHALQCATQHLVKGGTFVTKLYRSRDYSSYVWVLQQLFSTVNAIKPKASRTQSAEIFLVAQGYLKPQKIDPRLLNPQHVFADDVTNDTTGGSMPTSASTVSVLHKHAAKHDKRKRGGYDMEHFDSSLRHIEPVQAFVQASTFSEAVRILSCSTGLSFVCPQCKDLQNNDDDEVKCVCSFVQHHAFTTPEIRESLQDLQVLNKRDFKDLLAWREKMQEALIARVENETGNNSDNGNDGLSKASNGSNNDETDEEMEEKEIQDEITALRQRRLRERKRAQKKDRVKAAKRRRQAALGMDLSTIDMPDQDKLFSLRDIQNAQQLQVAAEVDLDKVAYADVWGDLDEDDMVVVGQDPDDALENGNQSESDDEDDDQDARRLRRMQRELDEAYDRYLSVKSATARKDTRMQKRSKRAERQRVANEIDEDEKLLLGSDKGIQSDVKTYVDMLQGPRDDSDGADTDSSDDDDDVDGFKTKPMTPKEHAQMLKAKKETKVADVNPLIHKFVETASAKTARWFSNPLFESIGKTARLSSTGVSNTDNKSIDDDDNLDSDSDSSTVSNDKSDNAKSSMNDKNKSAKKKNSESEVDTKKKKIGLDADEVIAMMPLTDKEKRHIKRVKAMARDERRKARRAKESDAVDDEFEIAPAEKPALAEDQNLNNLDEAQKAKVLKARELIKAGMGNVVDTNSNDNEIEIVAKDDGRPLPVADDRKYDSANEAYDSDDYAETLALGTMLLRRSKEKAFVDASYNRYAWNDPGDLPDWFVDDERKNYRPQLPIPPALLAKMKERMAALSTKPIAKVAEARARKQKRAKLKLAAAKKKAQAVANSADMTEAMKLKAISKALRGQDNEKKPSKKYVVAKKFGGGKGGGKGVTMVDRRLKNDKRAMKRAVKRKGKSRKH